MKWIQLSDLHISESTSWNMMNQAYKAKLDEIHPSFVLATGDLHNHGEDYEKAKTFLNDVCNSASIEKNHLIIIPGNHDSGPIRHKEDYIDTVLRKMEQDPDSYTEYLVDLSDAFEGYRSFYTSYFDTDDNTDGTSIAYKTIDNQINILLLNTALLSDGRDHPEILDLRSLSQLDIKNDHPVIAIGHHEISYIHEAQQAALKRIFTRIGVSAYLCGDLHKNSHGLISTFEKSDSSIPCIVCGKSAVQDSDTYSDFSFREYEYDETSGSVSVTTYSWSLQMQDFRPDNALDPDSEGYTFPIKRRANSDQSRPTRVHLKRAKSSDESTVVGPTLDLKGYVLIGPRGRDGIKYLWESSQGIIESIAFNQRVSVEATQEDIETSAYTSSVSHGCILSASNEQCLFCETGRRQFGGYLTAEEIALQNIFMAEYDSDCPSYPVVRKHAREFAYMGQGEPGQCYPALRRAILLTDIAMDQIRQQVKRHIISTCGIPEFMPLLIEDIKKQTFQTEVAAHFSLNEIGDSRTSMMPINARFDYEAFVKECEKLKRVTDKKIGLSIIAFNSAKIDGHELTITLSPSRLKQILDDIPRDVFRIDLQDCNSNGIVKSVDLSNESAHNLKDIAEKAGFEVRLSSCFGTDEVSRSGLGMLNSDNSHLTKPGRTTLEHYESAQMLLARAVNTLDTTYEL